jgi:cytochrome c2
MYNLVDNSDLTCAKCGSGSKTKGAYYVHKPNVDIYLCGFCHNIFQELNDKLWDIFMRNDGHNNVIVKKLMSKVSWNIMNARMDRKAGKSPWTKDQTCRFCENPESILSKGTCCTGCSKLPID